MSTAAQMGVATWIARGQFCGEPGSINAERVNVAVHHMRHGRERMRRVLPRCHDAEVPSAHSPETCL